MREKSFILNSYRNDSGFSDGRESRLPDMDMFLGADKSVNNLF